MSDLEKFLTDFFDLLRAQHVCPYESFELYQQKLFRHFYTDLEQFQTRLSNGFKTLLRHTPLSQQLLPSAKELKEALTEGNTLASVLSLSNETLQQFYQTASHLYREGDFANSADTFLALTFLNPDLYPSWLGLGLSEKALSRHRPAVWAFSFASTSAPQEPLPYYHAAHSFHALNETEDARLSINLALRFADNGSKLHQDALTDKQSLFS